jgi:hypothetical protein
MFLKTASYVALQMVIITVSGKFDAYRSIIRSQQIAVLAIVAIVPVFP